MRLFVASMLALATSVSRAPMPEEAPITKHVLFVVVGHGAGATYSSADYEPVLRRAARTFEREARVRLEWNIRELPAFGDELGYDARTFSEWFTDLHDATAGERYDVLAFAPDRLLRWCTDAHSLGAVFDGTAFTCLESPAPVALASNLLVHKVFHTFGFFHQQLRNKQWRLLDWEIGLPGYTSIADVGEEPEPFIAPFARDARWACEPGDARGECRDAVGPFSRDVDGDGVRDDRDGYPASPPLRGPDSDGDGIPDALDLCPGNTITVEGLEGGPMNFWSHDPHPRVRAFSNGRPLDIRWVTTSVASDKRIGDLMYFDDARERTSDVLDLPRGALVRVRVTYGERVRTFYVYGEPSRTSPGPWGYFDETEWLYFGRFGCDPPVNAGGRRADSTPALGSYLAGAYDANANSLPDAFEDRLATYDWDGDGVPDRDDTLPTVAGHCSDAHVRGVKDTDGDGFCDPGRFTFGAPPVDRATSFGELPVVFDDPDADRCPYRAGTHHGCPEE